MAKAEPIKGLDPRKPIFVNAALILKTRLGEMLKFEPFITQVEKVAELHQMRIAAKRLRYSLEIFQPLYNDYSEFGKDLAKATEEIKALQEHLGEMHDADVLVPELTAHLAQLLKSGYSYSGDDVAIVGVHGVDFDACEGIIRLCLETREDRDKRYQLFLKHWMKLRETRYFENLKELVDRAAGDLPAEEVAGISRSVKTKAAG